MRNLYHTCMFSTLTISFSEVWPRQTVCLMDVLKTSLIYPCNMSWRCLEDVFAKRLEDVFKTFLQDVLKTSWKRLEDVCKTNILVLIQTSWKRFQDVFWRSMTKANIFVLTKTSWRRLEEPSLSFSHFLYC